MTLRNLVATIGVLALLGACGGGGSSDPKSLCKKMFDSRLELFKVDDPESKRAMYMEECVKLDVEYLKCDANDTMSEKCMNTIKKHADDQDGLNTIMMTGKKPGQADKERADAEKAKNDKIAARQAARGKDVCSQICGKQRDLGFDPDEPDAIKKETECKTHCDGLVGAGGDGKTFVDEINGCMKHDGMADFYTCIGETNTKWRTRAMDDPPQW